jgi:putative ABC transport system permease protein
MLRQLRRHRAFAGALIAVLAVGVAVTTAMFSVVYGVLLRELPYPHADRLVTLASTDPRIPRGRSVAGAADYYDWRQRQQVFDNLAMVRPVVPLNLTGSGEPERLAGARITAGLCDTLGVTPILGRCFAEAEEREPERASSVVILSHALWQRRFGGDSAIVGRTIQLNGRGHEVVGVMGPSFRFPSREIEAWGALYIPPSALALRRDYSYLAVARLKAGVSVGAAAAQMATIAQALAREHPATNRDDTVSIAPMQSAMTATVRRPLIVLLGAVGMLFAITVFSIVNLVLVQLAGRAPELALRATLGASRPRLAAQLLGELVPLAVTGALIGLAGAYALLRSIVATLPATLPRVEEIGLHLPVALFGVALTAAAMGIPALVALWNARTSLRRGPASWVRLRDWLVTAQVAATVALLVASALFATSLARLRAVDAGLDATRVLTLQLAVDRARHGDDAGVAAYLGQLADAVRAVPGVRSVGLINRLPLGGQVQGGDLRVEGRDVAIATNWRSVDTDYLATLRVPTITGRGFDARDRADAPPVGIVDERFAASLGGPRAVLGKRFRIDAPGADDLPWVEIVGVVGHVRDEGLERDGRPLVYWPVAQRTQDRMAMVVRTATDPAAMATAVRQAIRTVDPDQSIADLRPMTAVIERSLETYRINAQFTALFAVLALGLAATGLFGVMASLNLRRRREFGVRLALGATRRELASIVLRQGLTRAALGVGCGLAIAALLAGSLRALLFGVTPFDVVAYSAVAGVMLAVAAAAAVVPAWHAARTDPLTSLRAEP